MSVDSAPHAKRYFTIVCFARCQNYNADDLSDEPDFNIVH